MPRVPFTAARRRFLQVVGAFAAPAALGGASLALAQASGRAPAPAKPRGAKASPDSTPPAAANPPAGSAPEISAEARTLTEVVKARYGAHLTVGQLEEVTKNLDRAVRSGKALRAVKLTNADEPDVAFDAAPGA